jgi:hypothetical protein
MTSQPRGQLILDAIEDEVHQRLNPSGDDCWYCGGDGYTFDCIDGCCEAADVGCEECTRDCIECRIFKRDLLKAVREEVIKSGDVEVATAWLKSIGRWHDGITDEQIRAELASANEKLGAKP